MLNLKMTGAVVIFNLEGYRESSLSLLLEKHHVKYRCNILPLGWNASKNTSKKVI